MIEFIVYGEPTAKGRPKFRRVKTNSGKEFVNTYTPGKTRKAEESFQAQAIQFRPEKPLDGALRLELAIYRSIPKSFSKKKRIAAISQDIFPVTKPDCDNYSKLIQDAMNTIFYRDDSQIVCKTVQKFYSEIPRVVVRLDYR